MWLSAHTINIDPTYPISYPGIGCSWSESPLNHLGWGYDHIFMTRVVNPYLNQCYHRSSNDHDLYVKQLGTRTRPHPADLVRCTMIDGVQCWSSATNLLGIVTHSYQCTVTPLLACWLIPITAYPHYKGAHFTESWYVIHIIGECFRYSRRSIITTFVALAKSRTWTSSSEG